jgi:signal transduction histidine kinase/CheY-like chemotaxis protein
MTSQEQILLMRMLKKQFVEVFKVDLDEDTYKFFCVGSNQIDYTIDGRAFWGNVHPDDRDNVMEYIRQVRTELMSDDSCEKSIQYRWPVDGDYRWEEIRLVRIFDDDAGHHVAMGTIKDVHDEVCAEIDNKRLLNQAIEDARSANAAKSAFLSGMSHEMRTPLNSIMCMTQLAMAKPDDGEYVQDMLNRIYESEKVLKSIINDILDIHRIESGKVTLNPTVFTMGRMMQDINNIISPMARSKGLDFTISIGARANCQVFADLEKLTKVFINLCANSVKYTPEGGRVRLSFAMKGAANGVGRYVFTVTDTGIGMDEECLNDVFSPYVRAKDSRIAGIDGTGLGLPIVKSMVEMMGGTIDLASSVGKGTTATVEIGLELMDSGKCAEGACATHGAACPVSAGGSGSYSVPDLLKSVSFQGKRVLLVDDRQENIFVEKSILDMLGLQVEVAMDGVEAVERFSESSEGYYDCIMMDVRMPRMNGYDATRRIRGMDRVDAASVPVYAMTADAFNDDVKASVECGMNGHLAKPMELGILVDTLKEALYR